jgi:hypothetical protein
MHLAATRRREMTVKDRRIERKMFSRPRAVRGKTSPSTSNSRHCQPVPSASLAPRYIRCRHRRFCFLLSPADHASATAAAAHGPCPGYPALGRTYGAATATPVAAPIPRPSRHQPLPPAALPGTSTPH